MKIKIYALTDVFYYSFYIEGFYSLYGKRNIEFSVREFPVLPERTFAAIIQLEETEIKIVIDAFDSPRVNKELLEWCDIYGKVNFNEHSSLTYGGEKIVAIGPSFGIRIWSFPETMKYSLQNFLKGRKRIFFRRNFFANYWAQYKRRPLEAYFKRRKTSDDRIYFISSLWKNEDRTNLVRSNFMRACMELNYLKFEGGFAPRREMQGFEDLATKRIGVKEYLKKIKESILVFNTPAVEDCHGWKLPEFLALGKAIVSTEHKNPLPIPLLHGEHLHYSKDQKEEIKLAVEEIYRNIEYRQLLERNARLYFERNLSPKIVVSGLLKKAINK